MEHIVLAVVGTLSLFLVIDSVLPVSMKEVYYRELVEPLPLQLVRWACKLVGRLSR